MSEHRRIVVIGAGFAGIGLAIRMLREGIGDFVVLEKAEDLGGTWQANTYPGIQCDIPSHLYSLSFMPNPGWTRTFSEGAEIWDYLRRCAREGGVSPHLRLDCDVLRAEWEEASKRWMIETSNGFAQRRGPDRRHRRAVGAGDPGHTRPRLLRRRALSLRAMGPRAGAARQEGRGGRDRRLGDPDRPPAPARGGEAPRLPAHSPLGDAPPRPADRARSSGCCTSASCRSAPQPRLVLPVAGVDRPRAGREPRPAGADGADRPRPSAPPGARPRAARPARAFLPARLQADPALERVVSGAPAAQRRAGRSAVESRRFARRGRWAPTARSGRSMRWSLRPGSTSLIRSSPTGYRDRAGALGRGLGERGGPGLSGRRRSPGSRTSSPWLGPNTGLGHNSIIYMIESQLNYLLDALRLIDRRRIARFEVRPEVQRAYNADLQRRLAGAVWSGGGCANWYLDEHGRNIVIWPRQTWSFGA